jgi:hypothetical protein
MTHRWAWAAAGLVLLPAAAGRAADAQEAQAAIDRGVAYLKRIQGSDGVWVFGPWDFGQGRQSPAQSGNNVGATALAGLTLLECGVPADDAHVRKAADVVRAACPRLTMTYALSLSILFLDRLGEPPDEVLIDSMALRLLAGQDLNSGGWNYDCPPLADGEVERLRTLIEHRSELVTKTELPRAAKGERTTEDLPKEIRDQWKQVTRLEAAGAVGARESDNSNTQFAVLALWVAHRQGMPYRAALERIRRRFHSTQLPDDGWWYGRGAVAMTPTALSTARSTPSMTCAALLGLALSHGSSLEATLRAGAEREGAGGKAASNPGEDDHIRRGFQYLGARVGKEQEWMVMEGPGMAMVGAPQPVPPGAPPGVNNPMAAGVAQPRTLYYGLWSLERVAVAYGLSTIGKKDWHAWGTDVLLRHQTRDGGLTDGRYAAGGCDTCFALLFLRRANLAQDLTTVLRGRVDDPGLRELRAGGVGGGALTRPGRGKPSAEPDATGAAPRTGAAGADAEAGRLAEELAGAGPDRRAAVLGRLRDGKGAAYTDALAQAIPKLTGEARAKARDALADRLTRMTAATLTDKLGDEDAEIRRAAALAAAMKEERSHVPRLIELLSDPEPPVARAAHAALKSLTGQDLGPEPDATRADIAQAAERWKDWWRKNGDK